MAVAWSWGRLGACEHTAVTITDHATAPTVIEQRGASSALPFGLGRSYGDVCLNPDGVMWHTRGMNRYIAFDDRTGILECEAGTMLGDIQRLAMRRGWALPVVPGTQYVTVGGAIANDVHGKNHHAYGSFGDHVLSLTLVRTTGETLICGPDTNVECFRATVGGLGLTGLVTTASLQLRPVAGPWLDTESIPFTGVRQFLELADTSETEWEHTVAWVDCLSKTARGVFLRANQSLRSDWREGPDRRIGIPFVPPVSLVNGLTLRPFNAAYYRWQAHRRGTSQSHYAPFFHPLDSIGNWNRLYGRRGFRQYQCVVPRSNGDAAMTDILRTIAGSGMGSFLAVLKTFGNRAAPGMLSFCRPGITLALDFPESGERTERLFQRLDSIVLEAGGCLYPAKDSRMSPAMFAAGYPLLDTFNTWRDPGISSSMSRRLLGS